MHTEAKADTESVMNKFVADFQLLRLNAGDVSYTQIAERVIELRTSRGETGSDAFVGRTTIYDAFRAGRSRINPDLVADIATVLGEDADSAARWRQYCIRARAEQTGRLHAGAPGTTSAVPRDPQPKAETSHWLVRRIGPRGAFIAAITMIVILSVLVNMGASWFAVALALPVYFDMIGTAIAAIALGPWYGVLVAIINHVAYALILWEWIGLPFVLVNITGALVWGYGVRSWRMGATPLRYFLLSLIAAISCTIVATPIIMIVFGGFSINVGAQDLAANLEALGQGIFGAVFSANILTSMVDKLISAFVALAVLPLVILAIPPVTRREDGMPETMNLQLPSVFTKIPVSPVLEYH